MVPTVWKLKPGADKRIRSGHPWIFSNELSQSPKGHVLGAPVELQDARGGFLARGYGNPFSLISFRALTFQEQERNPWSESFLQERLLESWTVRKKSGFQGSFRLCFGESDFLPGLICDYYLCQTESGLSQVFVMQIVTAGMQALIQDPVSLIQGLVQLAADKGLSAISFARTAIVLRNDVNVRKLEGMTLEDPKVLKEAEGLTLTSSDILIQKSGDPVLMTCDLFDGQKTGFFLDQTHNIELFLELLRPMSQDWKAQKTIRVLDLCCYVGHWSTQITACLKKLGFTVEVTQIDVSEPALRFAKKNAERAGAQVQSLKLDVTEALKDLPTGHYDIVIADPPAFIKAKKDVPIGKHAYLKMNSQAFRIVKSQGLVVSCSCSGLLTEEEFRDVLRKASQRNGLGARSLVRGGHAADHPTLMQFPEGFYLKMFTHLTS